MFLGYFKDIRTQEIRRDIFDRMAQKKTVSDFLLALKNKELFLDPAPLELTLGESSNEA